ncbi:MAG: hypothetical protein HYZ28_22135 [Myxococcales bacterium]|nr:hypothetical protein [Myxococcales bacterium]
MRQRRGSKAALGPLTVMAAVFFVPTYRACSDSPLESPLEFAADGLLMAAWVVPVFLFAGVFAAFTAVSLRRGQVDLRARRLGLGALGLFALSTIGIGAAMLADGGDWRWLAGALATCVAAGLLVRRARGRLPWQIWEHLLAAFAVLAAAAGPTVLLGGEMLAGSWVHLGPGAWLFIGAELALGIVLCVSLARRWAA